MEAEENKRTELPGEKSDGGNMTVSSENARIAEFRAKMAERTEEAKKAAEEKLARQEYEDSYRTRLAARDNRRAEAQRQKRLEAELAERTELNSAREQEILEYIRKEKEESMARAARTEALLFRMDNTSLSTEADSEEDGVSKAAIPESEDVVSESSNAESEKLAEGDAESENVANLTARDTENVTIDEKNEEPDTADTLIHIKEKTIDTGRAEYYYPPQYAHPVYPAYQMPNVTRGEMPPSMGYVPQYTPASMPGTPYAPKPAIDADTQGREQAIRDRDSAYERLREEQRLHDEEELKLIIEEGRTYDADAEKYRERREELLRRRESMEPYGTDEPIGNGGSDPSDGSEYSVPMPSFAKGAEPMETEEDHEEYRRAREIEEYEKYLEKKKGQRAGYGGSVYGAYGADHGREPLGEYPDEPIGADETGSESAPPEYVITPYREKPSYSVPSGADGIYDGAENLGEPDTVIIDAPIEDEELREIEDDISGTDKATLYKKLAIYHKEEDRANARRLKLLKKQKKLKGEERLSSSVELLATLREMVLLSEEELLLCVYAKNKKEITKHKKFLSANVKLYNKCVNEINAASGAKINELPADLAKAVEGSARLVPIATVRYNGASIDSSREAVRDIPEPHDVHPEPDIGGEEYIDPVVAPEPAEDPVDKRKQSRRDKQAEREDQMRFLREIEEAEAERNAGEEEDLSEGERLSAHERKKAEKDFQTRLLDIKRAKARDELLIAARIKYRVSRLEAKRDISELSFSVDQKEKDKDIRMLDRQISEEKALVKKAIRAEREDNEIYYSLFVTRAGEEKRKKRTDPMELASIRSKIELLLSEREELNERLIALYGSNDKKNTDSDKINSVRKRHARSMHKQQRKIAKQVAKLHIPVDRKQKIFDLLNRKTELVASIEENKYKIRHARRGSPTARAMKKEISRFHAEIRHINSDIKYMLRKADRQHSNYEANRSWIRWVVGIVVVAVIFAVVYFFAWDAIVAFVKNKIPGGAFIWL